MNDWSARRAVEFALAEIEIGSLWLSLAKIDRSTLPAHLVGARYACAEVRRHLAHASRDPLYGNVEASLDNLLAEIDSLDRENESGAASSA